MKLHSLTINNYRSIKKRTIKLPDQGVVIISGANEIGKSSMIEALNLLLESKDSSIKKNVLKVKPLHSDIGTEIVAEISTGPYRFIYKKRFHKHSETQLTIFLPRRTHLSGDEAHNRVLAMLAETVDMSLWEAQKVLQSNSTLPVDLSSSEALDKALNLASGEINSSSGEEYLLMERIYTEYLRYFTIKGRPTGEWATAIKNLSNSNGCMLCHSTEIDAVNNTIEQYIKLSYKLAYLNYKIHKTEPDCDKASILVSIKNNFRNELNKTSTIMKIIKIKYFQFITEVANLYRLKNTLDRKVLVVVKFQKLLDAAKVRNATIHRAQRNSKLKLDFAKSIRNKYSKKIVNFKLVLNKTIEYNKFNYLKFQLNDTFDKINYLCQISYAISNTELNEELVQATEIAALFVKHIEIKNNEIYSIRIQLNAPNKLKTCIGNNYKSIQVRNSHLICIKNKCEFKIVNTFILNMLLSNLKTYKQFQLHNRQNFIDTKLSKIEIKDLKSIFVLRAYRQTLINKRHSLITSIEACNNNTRINNSKSHLIKLIINQNKSIKFTALVNVKNKLNLILSIHQQSIANERIIRKYFLEIFQILSEKYIQYNVLNIVFNTTQLKLIKLGVQIKTKYSYISCHNLITKLKFTKNKLNTTFKRLYIVQNQLRFININFSLNLLKIIIQKINMLYIKQYKFNEKLIKLSIQLQICSNQDFKNNLHLNRVENEHLNMDYLQVRRRARAAKTLYSVMKLHRDAARKQYISPFKLEVERLGKIIFGFDFEVDIDKNLNICARTLHGHTVPYEFLSSGTKEQLAIIVRLASLVIVDKKDTVPMVIDDALGFADIDRLNKISNVFDLICEYGQIFILTCNPIRYSNISCAKHISLTE